MSYYYTAESISTEFDKTSTLDWASQVASQVTAREARHPGG